MEGIFKKNITIFIFCLIFLASPSQSQWFNTGYGGYPYGGYNYGGYYPNYGNAPYNQPSYGAPYGGYQAGGYYQGYGYSQPQYYGVYPYQPSGYAYNYNYGQQNYGGYYPNYGYYQPQYYNYSPPQYYGGYPIRQPNYQPYTYANTWGNYSSYNSLPYQYFGDPYTQQNPLYNPYGVLTGNWEDWSYLPSRYKDADLILDENDNNDDFTVDVGDSIAIILPSKMVPGYSITGGYEWAFDDDDFDDDIISHNNTSEWVSNYQFWYFEAEEAGTTTIKLVNVSWLMSSIGDNTFEVEITVEE